MREPPAEASGTITPPTPAGGGVPAPTTTKPSPLEYFSQIQHLPGDLPGNAAAGISSLISHISKTMYLTIEIFGTVIRGSRTPSITR